MIPPVQGQTGKYINPFTDWGFKRIFKREQHKDLLLTFLNDLFEGEKVITDITYLESDLQAENWKGRNSVFDIVCTDQRGERYIVEMRNKLEPFILERLVYYTCRLYADSGVKGVWNFEVSGVIAICLANFHVAGNPKLKTEYILTDKEENARTFDKMKIILLQLPKVPPEYKKCDNEIKKWLFLLIKMNSMDTIMSLAEKKAAFKKLLEVSNLSALSKRERAQYECNLKHYRVYMNQLDYADKQGEERGVEKGREEGMREGLEAGVEKGKIQAATSMKLDGMSAELISRYTGLTLEQIEKL